MGNPTNYSKSFETSTLATQFACRKSSRFVLNSTGQKGSISVPKGTKWYETEVANSLRTICPSSRAELLRAPTNVLTNSILQFAARE